MTLRAALVSLVLLVLAPPPPARLSVEGRFFVAGKATFRPLFASGLALLARTPSERTRFLDEVAALGFNGVRVFAGALEWAGQTPPHALDVLPSVLAEAAKRRLYVEVTAITDSATGYDVERHLREVAVLCAKANNCLLEAANEYYHPTQSAAVQDPARLSAIARRAIRGPLWALGAPPFDTLQPKERGCTGRCELEWPIPAGDYITVHLERGAGWDQLARLRELARISEITGKPVLNNEPIGAAEQARPGRRESDAEFFFALGAMSRLLELGAVFHSEDGRYARPLGPAQRRAARAFVQGFRAIATTTRLALVEPSDSPVAAVGGGGHVFTARAGRHAWVVVLDGSGAGTITWRPGWRTRRTIRQSPGLRVLEARR